MRKGLLRVRGTVIVMYHPTLALESEGEESLVLLTVCLFFCRPDMSHGEPLRWPAMSCYLCLAGIPQAPPPAVG